MALFATRYISQLDDGLVITPERYNPLRTQQEDFETSTALRDIARLVNRQVKPGKNALYYTANTTDAQNGRLYLPDNPKAISSNKKAIACGNVLISRLRPYLKQVAYCDMDRAGMVASTEFYVLESLDGENIAFLVPFLLSEKAQIVFANSVEGSQHPRFKAEDLLNLRIPNALLKQRDKLSLIVEDALRNFRVYEEKMRDSISRFDS